MDYEDDLSRCDMVALSFGWACIMMAMLIGVMLLCTMTGVHAVVFHDSSFVGLGVGTHDHAVIAGHGAVNGFVLDATAKLD